MFWHFLSFWVIIYIYCILWVQQFDWLTLILRSNLAGGICIGILSSRLSDFAYLLVVSNNFPYKHSNNIRAYNWDLTIHLAKVLVS